MRKKIQRFDHRQNMHGNTFEIFHYLDPETRHLETHYHNFYEIYFFIGGNVDYWIDGRVYHLHSGDILLIQPTQLHKPVPKGGIDRYERMVLWIDQDYLAGLQDGVFTACFQQELLRLPPESSAKLFGLAYEMNREYYTEEFGGKVCAYSLLLQLLAQTVRCFSKQDVDERSSTPTRISEILAYINEHYHENLCLDSLASHFFVSKFYLSHEFKKAVGTSIYRYITAKRLNQAYFLLRDGCSAGETGVRCGFGDYTAFYRAFKAEYGHSPAQLGKTESKTE